MPDQVLQNRVAFVTGGSSGIGLGCVQALAAAGADVCIGYRGPPAEGDAAAALVTGVGRKALAVPFDVSDEASVDGAFDACTKALGVADILVNSAGINMAGTKVADMTLARWNQMLAVDLTGSFLTSRRVVRDLTAAKKPGAIINITSIHAFAMRAGGADYDAAKGGQTNLTRTLAIETAAAGITVNAIAPGMILTPMNEHAMADPAYRRSLEQNIPLQRAGTPEDVAALAVFLASPAASYITGTEIVIDGGLSLLAGLGA